MAEGFLSQFLGDVGADAQVRSAGTLCGTGRPATPEAVHVMAERGIDISGHASRKLTTEAIERADIVIAMTRAHAWATIARDESKLPVTFLPAELPRLARSTGPRLNGEPISVWAARLTQVRPLDRPIGWADEEIDDPAGEPLEVYERVADQLEHSLAAIAPYLGPT